MHIDANLVVLYVFSVVVMIAMPGPVAVFVAGTGIVGGPKLALRAIAGTNAGSLVLIVLSMLVVQGLLSINETVFTLLKGGGALHRLSRLPDAARCRKGGGHAGGDAREFHKGLRDVDLEP